MNRLMVMDGHCDTVYRCWSMGEELPYNTGALELSSALDTFGGYAQIFALWTAKGYVGGECLEATCKCQLGYFRRQMSCYSHLVTPCTTASQAREANQAGKCAPSTQRKAAHFPAWLASRAWLAVVHGGPRWE